MRSRWMSFALLVGASGCDHASDPADPAMHWRDGEAAVEIRVVTCEPTPEPLVRREEREPELGFEDWIRSVDALERVGPEHTVAVGRFGDFFTEGLWFAVFDATGEWVADAIHPVYDNVDALLVATDGESLWASLALRDDGIALYRHDGEQVRVDRTIAGIRATALEPTPNGGVVIVGTLSNEPVVVGLDRDGEERWRGSTRQETYPRVEADGPVRYFGDGGGLAWEHDLRDAPFASFRAAAGLRRASLSSEGDVLAAGAVLGEAGSNALVARFDPGGAIHWTLTRPRAAATIVREGPNGSTLIQGLSTVCSEATWIAVVDAAGELVVDGRVDRSFSAQFAIDVAGRIFAVEARGGLKLAWYGEVPQ